MVQRDEIIQKRMGETLPPAEGSVIAIKWFERNQIFKSFQHRVEQGRFLNRFWSNTLTSFGLFVFAPSLTVGAGAAFLSVGIDAVRGKMLLDHWLMFTLFLAASLILVLILKAGAQFFARNINDAIKEVEPNFDNEKNAQHWSKVAKKVLKRCADKKIVRKLSDFFEDKKTPYRILQGYLPVPIFEFRRPAEFVEGGLLDKEPDVRKKRLFEIDSLCGGVLSLLGAMPKPRYSTTKATQFEPVVHDLYWRNDVQEVADADQADVFLRFHQSVIEEDHDATCFYKTFAALNNFRRTPILLLRVRDIVDCLTNKSKDYDPEDHAKIYEKLSVNDKNVISLLCEDNYLRYPPRIERVSAKAYNPKKGRVLFSGEGGDYAMLFDPSRVWVELHSQPHIEALVALRSAIHLASRTKTIGIVLKKRDLLVVDNRRALVARQEDRPGFSPFDAVAQYHKSLEGRWIRKIYGFRGEGDDGKDNFQLIDTSASEAAKSAVDKDGGNHFAEPPASLLSSPCGDVIFDFGLQRSNWPTYLTQL